jgi:nitroreductase/NAD-dependent dihydropyrimidine dehydrogenase PreA subunit
LTDDQKGYGMALLRFDESKCQRDGKCVASCPARVIQLIDDSPVPTMVEGGDLRCSRCGHCVAVCPYGAVSHFSIKPEECPPVRSDLALSSGQVEYLLRSRRSIRVYQQREVEHDKLQRVIDIARYAPTGANLQRVTWVVINSPTRVREIAAATIDLARSIIGKDQPSVLAGRESALVDGWDAGRDPVARNAPALVVACAVPGDIVVSIEAAIALSFLDLVAPSFGLGTCWGGHLMRAIPHWPPLHKALGLADGNRFCAVMMIGYPEYAYHKLPPRDEPKISWYEG